MADFLAQHSRGRIGRERARLILETARHSVGSPAAGEAYASILPSFIANYRALAAQVDRYTAQLETCLAAMKQTLTTIPGIGPVLAATILAEIGEVGRFPGGFLS